MKIKKIFPGILFLISFSLNAESYLSGEFIYNLDIDMIGDPFESPNQSEYERIVINKLLEEARWVFSGMIYGFDIVYTPSDRSRAVEQFYQIDPIAQINSEDSALEVYDTFMEGHTLHLYLKYKLNEYQSRRIEYWNSGVFTSAAAFGKSPLYEENSRISSVEDAIRVSLESILKPEEFNKPSIIEAQVLLRYSPSISIDAGHNRAFVKLRVDIKNVQHYFNN